MDAKRTPKLVKITVILNPADNQGVGTESLWAEALGNDRYRIRNSPFFVYGLSNEDIVVGKLKDGVVKFHSILLRGNHSTYRLKLPGSSINDAKFLKYWEPLQKIGCSFEEGPLVSVDVPPQANIYTVYDLLKVGESDGIWEFEEGHCGHRLAG